VYDAMEAGNVKRLVLIGAVDIRDRSKGYPEWYDDADSGSTHICESTRTKLIR
jgi:hypothetical protein